VKDKVAFMTVQEFMCCPLSDRKFLHGKRMVLKATAGLIL